MNRVAKKIISEAEKKAGEIRAKASDDTAELILSFEKNESRLISEQKNELDLIYKNEKSRLESLQRIKERNELLSEKHKLLNTIESDLKKRITGDEKLYKEFIEAILLNGIKTGEEEIICSENDRDIFTGEFIESINQKAKEKIPEANVKLSDEIRSTGGGAILKEGKIELNLCLDTVLDYLFYEHLIELSELLFRENR